MRPRILLALVAVAGALLAPVSAATACVSGHLGVRWITFQPPVNDFGPVFFYHAVEPPTTTNVPVTIQGTGDDCSGQPVVGTYQVADPPAGTSRAATAGLDYSAIFPPRTTAPLYGYHAQGQTEHGDTVPVVGDALPETVVEQAQALITSSTGRRDFPFDVPFYIVDDDGTDRVSFEHGGPYERSETYGSIAVPVFRAGPATATAAFALTATGSSANPATAGEDYVSPPGSVSF